MRAPFASNVNGQVALLRVVRGASSTGSAGAQRVASTYIRCGRVTCQVRSIEQCAQSDAVRWLPRRGIAAFRGWIGGAEIAVVPSMTPHMCASELSQLSVLPLVDLIAKIVREVHARQLRRVALFGTRFTIETKMFGKLVGLDVVMPDAEEIDSIHGTYIELVSAGRGTEEQYQRLRGIAHTLCERDGVEAIILGGTELSLLFNPANTDFPHIDGARLHLEAIMRELFRGEAGWRT